MDELKRIYDEISTKYRMRFYPKQKSWFRDFVIAEFKKQGFEDINVDKAKNIIIGDVDKAKRVYAAHYDTPMLSFYLTPFARIFGHLLGTFISALVMVVLMLTVPLLLSLIPGIIGQNSAPIGSILLLAFFLMHFFPNPNNANDNTSGVLSVMLAANILRQNNRLDETAFILFNNEELGLLGSGHFVKEYQMRNKYSPQFLVYNFDCTGIGEYIFVATRGEQAKIAATSINDKVQEHESKSIIQKKGSLLFGSDYLRFPNGMMLTAVNRSAVGSFYLPRIHMPNDNKLDFDRISKICDYVINSDNDISTTTPS